MAIEKTGHTQGINPIKTTGISCKTDSEIIESIFNSRSNSDSNQAGFKTALLQSPLDDRIPNLTTLKKLGFGVPFNHPYLTGGKDSPYILDMNGGKTYQNKNGDTIRICDFEQSVTYESKDKKICHEIFFDPEGNPLKGTLRTKNEDGSFTNYKFDYDLDGNPELTDSMSYFTN